MAKTSKTKPKSEATYTIDSLAAHTQVPSRTIRFYQSKGALAKPQIKGRVAYYDESHVERLALIQQLQDRGLRIKAICEIVGKIDRGELTLEAWLGIEQQLHTPWIDDQPQLLTESELYKFCGQKRPGLIADLVDSELIERKGDQFLVNSPSLLKLIFKIEESGIPIHIAHEAGKVIRRNMERLSAELVDFYVRKAAEPLSQSIDDQNTAELLAALRPIGLEAVNIMFSQTMTQVLAKLVESGKAAELTARMHGKKS